MQPLISPFYGGKSEHEILAALLGDTEASSYQIVQSTWQNSIEGDFDTFWQQAVYAGTIAGSQAENKTVSVKSLGEAEASKLVNLKSSSAMTLACKMEDGLTTAGYRKFLNL